MGRRSRHTAKTGDKSLYKSRPTPAQTTRRGDGLDSDDDPTYDEVDRYHNRREEESMMRLDDDDDDDDSAPDDGITTNREGVFDLGMGGSSDEDDYDESDHDEGGAGFEQRQAPSRDALASEDDDSDEDDDEGDEERDETKRVFHWGAKKQDYYHGDTADLEIGQDVEDAYLEEEAGREVEKARLDAMEEGDFMLDGEGEGDVGDEDEESDGEKPSKKLQGKKKKRESTSDDKKGDRNAVETIQSVKNPKMMEKLSKKEKLRLLKVSHPELLPLVDHFRGPVKELLETTLVAGGALLKNGSAKEAEVRAIIAEHLFHYVCWT